MPKLISLDANISAGKSTLISALEKEENMNFLLVQEPVNDWLSIKNKEGISLLDSFYDNKKEYAFTFQIQALFSRYKALSEAFKKAELWEKENPGKTKIILTERSIFSDYYIFATMLYEDKYMCDIQFEVYKNWYNEFKNKFPIDACIYIKADPKTCLERINSRHRKGEERIHIEYLDALELQHEKFYNEHLSKNKCLIISNEDDINTDEYRYNLNKIIDFINNC